MTAPIYTADDFICAMQALLPRGRIWPRDADATVTAVLSGLAPTYARQSARSMALLVDAFPATAIELLQEWEKTLGIPYTGDSLAATIQGRQAAVVAKLIAVGGQSAPYFISIAASLGYAIEVINYTPFRTGQSRCGQPLGGEDWFFCWSVEAAEETVTPFRAGRSGAGEPLASWGNLPLESLLNRYKPAHSILQFHYGS